MILSKPCDCLSQFILTEVTLDYDTIIGILSM